MKFQVKYELGVGKREVHNYEVTIKDTYIQNSNFQIFAIQIYQYTNKTFVKSNHREFTSWGGSDTCQVMTFLACVFI